MGAELSTIPCLRFCGGDDADGLGSSSSNEYQPLLGDRERHAVAALVKLFESDRQISFYDGEPLKALTVLAHSNVHHLQLSAATAFSEISEYDVRPVSRAALGPILYLLQSEYPDVQQGASLALGNLASVSENKRLVVEMGGLELLVRQMLSPSTDAQINSVGCITNLAADEASKLAIARSGALVPLTRLARSRDVRVQRNATGALLNMTHQAELRLLLVEAGAVAVLVDLLDAGDDETQYYTVTALSNIAVDAAGRGALWDAAQGLVGMLLLAIKAPKIRIQAQVALTLRNLASDERYQRSIVSHGGLDALVPLLQSSYTALVISAAACLRNISIHPSNEEPIVGAGLLPELMDLVAQADQPELQCHAIATVRNLAANSGTDKQVFVDAGLFDRLRMVLASKATHSSVLCEAAAVFSVLALSDQLWRPVVELDFCRLLVQLTHTRHMDTEYNACLAIGTLAGRGQPEVFEELLRVWRLPSGGLREFLARVLALPEYAASNVRPVAVWVVMALLNSGRADLKKAIGADEQLIAAIADIGQARAAPPPSSVSTATSWALLPAIFGSGGKLAAADAGADACADAGADADVDGCPAPSILDGATAVDACRSPAPDDQRMRLLARQIVAAVSPA
ncbi:Vacuolar protein 8 [Coemansia biformis]|uniref:Vacuolar protein 8 n=1 Tax=Coemansia biformis TaxID=1286918 RepID=A0A9W7YHR8_9FUNG|nr:Vacuolar protein 8 [Coemansia biformis]